MITKIYRTAILLSTAHTIKHDGLQRTPTFSLHTFIQIYIFLCLVLLGVLPKLPMQKYAFVLLPGGGRTPVLAVVVKYYNREQIAVIFLMHLAIYQ